MADDERVGDLFADLEQQAEAAYAVDREAELADRARAEYAGVRLAGRLMASVGQPVTLEVRGAGVVSGVLDRVGDDSCRVLAPGVVWLVALPAVTTVRGASPRAVAEAAWSPLTRLGLGAGLRALTGLPCLVYGVEGARLEGRVHRVGADFVEVAPVDGVRTETVLIALTAVAAVRSAEGEG